MAGGVAALGQSPSPLLQQGGIEVSPRCRRLTRGTMVWGINPLGTGNYTYETAIDFTLGS